MATWILDTNIVLYLLTREDQLEKAHNHGPATERHLRRLYEALDRFVADRLDAGDRFILSLVVVQETLNVLQYSEAFGLEARQAAEVMLALVHAKELDCEERECVVHALESQAAGEAPFVDAYLPCRSQEEAMHLLTNDRELANRTGGKAVLLRNCLEKS